MKKPKVAVIGLKGLPAFGGAASVGENLIRELKNEYIFTVYAVSSHTSSSGTQDGYTQIVFKNFFIKKLNIFFYYLRSALHCLFSGDYDLIHLHHIDGAFILPILKLRYKVLCTSHAQPQISEKWPVIVKVFFKINEKIAIKLSDTLTVVSLTLKEQYDTFSRDIFYIPNGISLDQKISEDKITSEPYILFAAGRIIPLKGLHILLKALKKADQIERKLLVIGDLNQVPSYKEVILDLSKGLNIEFIPLIRGKEILLNYVKNAGLFVFPSYSENMSVMLLEVAFTKTPLICSDIPANTAVFNKDETLFFRTNDENDLSEKIDFALSERKAMSERTEAAYNKVVTTYNWKKIAPQYSLLYQKHLKN